MSLTLECTVCRRVVGTGDEAALDEWLSIRGAAFDLVQRIADGSAPVDIPMFTVPVMCKRCLAAVVGEPAPPDASGVSGQHAADAGLSRGSDR